MRNKLSVFTFPYTKRYYLTHPHKFINDLYWNIRNFIFRGRKGFAYVDAWNICEWYPRVGAEAIRYLANNGSGYPCVDEWPTPEAWKEYLLNLADRLEHCANMQDFETADENNEYAKPYEDSGYTDAELGKKYFARAEEISEEFKIEREETFKEVGRVLLQLWD